MLLQYQGKARGDGSAPGLEQGAEGRGRRRRQRAGGGQAGSLGPPAQPALPRAAPACVGSWPRRRWRWWRWSARPMGRCARPSQRACPPRPAPRRRHWASCRPWLMGGAGEREGGRCGRGRGGQVGVGRRERPRGVQGRSARFGGPKSDMGGRDGKGLGPRAHIARDDFLPSPAARWLLPHYTTICSLDRLHIRPLSPNFARLQQMRQCRPPGQEKATEGSDTQNDGQRQVRQLQQRRAAEREAHSAGRGTRRHLQLLLRHQRRVWLWPSAGARLPPGRALPRASGRSQW